MHAVWQVAKREKTAWLMFQKRIIQCSTAVERVENHDRTLLRTGIILINTRLLGRVYLFSL
ncbi:MAG: hypothetical protein D3904_09910 [Candidatus Electrothrix sp. EH2]|nr:hypothetical protein [Candidatus Electrothrix sp. EH2]